MVKMENIVAPVVVYPDIISKNASVKEGIEPCNTKGRADNAEITTHPKVVMRNASLSLRLSTFLNNSRKTVPANSVIPAEINSGCKSPSFGYNMAHTIGKIIDPPVTNSRFANTNPMFRVLFQRFERPIRSINCVSGVI